MMGRGERAAGRVAEEEGSMCCPLSSPYMCFSSLPLAFFYVEMAQL